MAAVPGKAVGVGSARGKKKEVKVMKTIYDLARNAVTTLVSVTAAALASTQGDASTGCRVAGTVLLFIFLKWLMLDAWDGIRDLVWERR